MCGITGFIDFSMNIRYNKEMVIKDMNNTLDHRGPDDKGYEIFEEDKFTIALGQARLSIIDLTSAGHQPMRYKNFTIVFNGEIYNYRELKNELIELGHEFHTDSDTEVVLHCYEQWREKAVNKFIGMFAIVIYDSATNKVCVFRDRAGVKPFYYYYSDQVFIFASELKAFHKHPKFQKEIDRDSIYLYFKNVHHGYVPAPKTIFKNTFNILVKTTHVTWLLRQHDNTYLHTTP